MTTLEQRTRALLASARAIDAKEFRTRLSRLRLSVLKQGKLVRQLVKAVLYHDARLRAIEKRLREK